MSRIADNYAEAFFAVIQAEGNVNEIQDELFRFARIFEGNDELRTALNDPHLPAAKRQAVVEDLLAGRAHPVTVSLISLLVSTGRTREIGAVIDKLLKRTAALTSRVIAEVRSAVELNDDQKARLATSLRQATGQEVDVVVIIDPAVLGGIVTQIGDTVIDGTVRHRLAQLKESF